MDVSPMKILIIEDDMQACDEFKKTAKERDDIKIVGTTGSDIKGFNYLRKNKVDGVILDLELNNSEDGNSNAFEFISKLKELPYTPIIIVTTHVNSERTYKILHRNKIDLIMYKEQPNYSCNMVFNTFLNYRNLDKNDNVVKDNLEENLEEKKKKLIEQNLDLIGITSKLKGRSYIEDSILYLLQDEGKSDYINVIKYVAHKHGKSESTITNGIQNAISHAWSNSPIEDLMKYYTVAVSYKTGEPTPMELIYYYVNKIKKEI